MRQTIHLSDGSVFQTGQAPPPPPAGNIPDRAFPGPGWDVFRGDGQRPAVRAHDYDVETRDTPLGETGEWDAVHWIDESDGRVKNPKHIVNLQGTTWLEFMRDVLGDFNFSQKARHEDGTEDTNDDSIPVLLPDGSINPDKPRKQMCTLTGGAKINVTGEITQGGKKFYIIESLDFYSPPEKVDGVWKYKGKPVSWDTHPHLFTSRVNRKKVNSEVRTWISRRGVQAVSDGGVDELGNLLGAKLKEWWPNPSKAPVCVEAADIRPGQWIPLVLFYPELPATIHLYKNSVIVDGELTPQSGGIEITIDAYRFRGSNVYVRNQASGNWFLAEEMLVRADLSTGYYARATDYRCYATLPGEETPWMGDRGYGVPDPGVWRKDMGLMFYLRALAHIVTGFLRE